MKLSELSVGNEVVDRWYPEWGVGIVEVVKKTVVYIKFSGAGDLHYDAQHTQFLEWYPRKS